jgi:uncharacterized protein
MNKKINLNDIVSDSRVIHNTLSFLRDYNREKVHLVAGAVAQTVWNHIYENDLKFGIEDLDLVYYNNNDLSADSEEKIKSEISNGLKLNHLKLDIKNQARIHLWYYDKFGYNISPVVSINDAIDRFPTTATSIGIRYNEKNELDIYAPFGLDDLFAGIIRANKKQITETIFNDKVDNRIKKWPNLHVIKW